MKIALVHDHLVQHGGAEEVLRVFHELWPDAPTFTLIYDPARMGNAFKGKEIRTSYLQDLPFARKKYKWFLPMIPAATESYDLREFDVVVSSASAFAKGVITKPETLHICYCHTPPRYLWTDTNDYVKDNVPTLLKPVMPYVLSRLRAWDHMASNRVDRFIANSTTVQSRIKKYYQRQSDVLYPPVQTSRYAIAPKVGDYYVAGGRLVAYKRFDMVVAAFNKLGLPLKIFGDGPELKPLRAVAKQNIQFMGRVSEPEKAALYANAIAYIHPQEEDFGITAVEAMAAGRPVIAYRKGGASETIIDGVTGVFIDEQTWEALANEVIRFDASRFNPQTIREHARQFDAETFKKNMRMYVEQAWQEWQLQKHENTIRHQTIA